MEWDKSGTKFERIRVRQKTKKSLIGFASATLTLDFYPAFILFHPVHPVQET